MSNCQLIDELQALSLLGCETVEDRDPNGAMEIYQALISKLEASCWLSPTPMNGAGIPQESSVMEVYCGIHDEEPSQSDEEDYSLDPGKASFFTRPFNFECSGDKGERKRSTLSSCGSNKNSCQQLTELSGDEYTTMAVTALFNVGLCRHLHWKRQQERSYCEDCERVTSQDSLLFEALRFYEQAYALTRYQRHEYIRHDQQDQEDLWMKDHALLPVVRAICANATHCQKELGMVHLSEWKTRLMRLLLLSRTKNNRKKHGCPTVHGDMDRGNKRRRLSDTPYAASSSLPIPFYDQQDDEEEELSAPESSSSSSFPTEERCDPCADSIENFLTMNAFYNSFPCITAQAA
mmetsp:Transcript_15995/g.44023  ORF Transcript_15995/g.44023 Transcript_15995/m.44023 type:complete len:349 (-) Transcript_15995:126-1172(-)